MLLIELVNLYLIPLIQKIEKTILTKSGADLENWFQQNKSPFSGYYEVCEESQNTMIQFCNKLMSDYCYPKEKIIKYLQNYLTQRYTVMGRVQSDENTFNKFSKVFGHVKENYVKSYIILLDDWSQNKNDRGENEYFNNLYFVNKSNLFRANNLQYSQDINYYKEKKNILAIPLYLYGMMDEGDESGDESEYSSTCGDDGNSIDWLEWNISEETVGF